LGWIPGGDGVEETIGGQGIGRGRNRCFPACTHGIAGGCLRPHVCKVGRETCTRAIKSEVK